MVASYYPLLTGLLLCISQLHVLASPVLLWSNKNLPQSPVSLSAVSTKNLISNDLCQLKDAQVQLRLFAVNDLTIENIQWGSQRDHPLLVDVINGKSDFRYYPNIVNDVYKTFSLLPRSNDMKCSHIHFQLSSTKVFETLEEALNAIQANIDSIGPDSTNAVVIALVSQPTDSSTPSRRRRQTPNANAGEEVIVSSDKSCMFYAAQLYWNSANGTKSSGQGYDLLLSNSTCQLNTTNPQLRSVTLDLVWENQTIPNGIVRMSLVATIVGSYWQLTSAVLNNTDYLYFAYGMQSFMDTPPRFSYACNSAVFVRYDTSGKYGAYNFNDKFYIENLQFQPFNGDGLSFGPPNYCTSFFTSGIWMGITSSFLCLGILLFGVHRLMSIKSNDRFDDPKGKPLLIKAQE